MFDLPRDVPEQESPSPAYGCRVPQERPLVHPRTRIAFREHCSDAGTVRMVAQVFEGEGLEAAPDGDDWYTPGQRRGTFDRYTHAVDWNDPIAVRAVLNAFEEIYTWGGDDEWGTKARERLRRHLERDGYRVDDRGRIRTSAISTATELPLESLTDPSAILEHLDRIADATDRDPALAISASKALIEATTKHVLLELGEPLEAKAKMPALVQAAQKALKLHPNVIAPTAPGVEITKRLLSNLSQVAIGVAELRNEYGPDHGRTGPSVRLGRRHAHLAVGCATTFCRMLIETLDARRESEAP